MNDLQCERGSAMNQIATQLAKWRCRQVGRQGQAAFYLVLLLVTLLLGGCGLFAAEPENVDPVAIRTPKPTFTPTSPAPPPTQTPQVAASTGAADEVAPAQDGATLARAVVNSPLVNVRPEPSVDSEVITMVERGAEYDIVARSGDGEWWQICCIEGQPVWISASLVDTDGPVDSVPVAGQPAPAVASQPNAAAPATPAANAIAETPVAAAVTPPAPPPVAENFALESQEQFAETGPVRIYAYIYAGDAPLEGYSLRVSKDGAEMPVTGTSFGGQPAFTWPFQDARQRYQNFKVEYSDVEAVGTWEVTIVDSNGTAIGPTATFTLNNNDPEQELYVRYQRQ